MLPGRHTSIFEFTGYIWQFVEYRSAQASAKIPTGREAVSRCEQAAD